MLQLVSVQLLVKQMIHAAFIMTLGGLRMKNPISCLSSQSKPSQKVCGRCMNAGFPFRLRHYFWVTHQSNIGR